MSEIILSTDIDASADDIFEILTTTKGQASFWTSDCDVDTSTARFGFAAAPVDLECSVSTEPGRKASFTIDSGFPFWNGSVFSWELGPSARQETGTNVLFRHEDFEDGYADQDLGFTAFTWGLVLNALKAHAETGEVAPALG